MSIRHVSLVPLMFLPCLLLSAAHGKEAQQKPPAFVVVSPAAPDPAAQYSKESMVLEKISTTIAYQADGTGEKTMQVTARVQSDNGVHQAGLLDFTYASGNEHLDIVYVRVRKPDGTVVDTPATDAQDMPTQVTREAPLYSDLREIQIPVKSLSVGDTLEYQIHYTEQKAAAPNQFWGAATFVTSNVVLDESNRAVVPQGQIRSRSQPEEHARHIRRKWPSHLQVEV